MLFILWFGCVWVSQSKVGNDARRKLHLPSLINPAATEQAVAANQSGRHVKGGVV